jgi:hypothetical protein
MDSTTPRAVTSAAHQAQYLYCVHCCCAFSCMCTTTCHCSLVTLQCCPHTTHCPHKCHCTAAHTLTRIQASRWRHRTKRSCLPLVLGSWGIQTRSWDRPDRGISLRMSSCLKGSLWSRLRTDRSIPKPTCGQGPAAAAAAAAEDRNLLSII